MNDEEEKKRLHDLVQKCVNQLGEHFDSVQIFCTKEFHNGKGDTAGLNIGSGNFYARWAQAREWVLAQDQHARDRGSDDAPEET